MGVFLYLHLDFISLLEDTDYKMGIFYKAFKQLFRNRNRNRFIYMWSIKIQWLSFTSLAVVTFGFSHTHLVFFVYMVLLTFCSTPNLLCWQWNVRDPWYYTDLQGSMEISGNEWGVASSLIQKRDISLLFLSLEILVQWYEVHCHSFHIHFQG